MEQAKTTEGLFRDFFLLFQQTKKNQKYSADNFWDRKYQKNHPNLGGGFPYIFIFSNCFRVFVIAKWLQLNLLLSIVMLALSSLQGIWTLSQICCLKHTLSFFPLSHWLFFISFCNFHWKMSTVMLIMSETKTLSKSFLFAHFLFSLETVLPLARCLLTAIQPATKPALKTEVARRKSCVSLRLSLISRLRSWVIYVLIKIWQ